MDTLHVYLKREVYGWYNQGKTHELRVPVGEFAPEKIMTGKGVVLHRGNSGITQSGNVGEVITDSLDVILKTVDANKIAPPIKTSDELMPLVHKMLGVHDKYVCFEVILD